MIAQLKKKTFHISVLRHCGHSGRHVHTAAPHCDKGVHKQHSCIVLKGCKSFILISRTGEHPGHSDSNRIQREKSQYRCAAKQQHSHVDKQLCRECSSSGSCLSISQPMYWDDYYNAVNQGETNRRFYTVSGIII